MKFAKRSLSMLLIFCMIFGMIPFVASAAEGGEQGNVRSGSIFKDVKETSWYYDAVNYVYTNGIMVGTSDDLFSPGEVTSRSMLVTILYGMEGKPVVQSESPFTDVANGRWYTDAIVWASENGIVSGYGNGIFGYKDAVNRQQTAMILYRYAEYKGYNTEITGDVSSFVDRDDISSYAVDALSWAVGKGLISGTGSNMISPKGSATRSQIAVIVMQFDREIAGGKDSVEVSRDKWICMLVDELALDLEVNGIYSFDDPETSSDPESVEKAIRFGIVELEPDKSNMLYFCGDEAATREFAAVTLYNALKFVPVSDEVPYWDDVKNVSCLNEAVFCVEHNVFSLINNCFEPQTEVTLLETEDALKLVTSFVCDEFLPGESNVDFVDYIEQTVCEYRIDESRKRIYFNDPDVINDFYITNTRILRSESGDEKDIAVEITSIEEANGVPYIEYAEPELYEVVESFDISGILTEGGSITPAEGVVFTNQPESRINASGEVPLFGELSFTFTDDDREISGSVDIKNIEYRFVVDSAGNSMFGGLDEVYFALNAEMRLDFDYSKELINIDKIKLCDIKAPLPFGINAAGALYIVFDVSGSVGFSFEVETRSGVQFLSGSGMRPVCDLSYDIGITSVKGEAKLGIAIEPAVEFFGIDLVSLGAEVGVGAEAEMFNVNNGSGWFCIDGVYFVFADFYIRIGPESLNLETNVELMNSDGPFVSVFHFEETGMVDECTRGRGDYEGFVVRADDCNIPISHAIVRLYRNGRLIDTTYTDEDGSFTGVTQNPGSYTLRVFAPGYFSGEFSVEIIGGQTTDLDLQLEAIIVTDALNYEKNVIPMPGLEGFGFENEKHTVILPKINKNTANADAFNLKMYNDFSDIYERLKNNQEYAAMYDVAYEYKTYGSVLGIAIIRNHAVQAGGGSVDYRVYYYDLINDKELSLSEYLAVFGLDDHTLFSLVKDTQKFKNDYSYLAPDYEGVYIRDCILDENSAVVYLNDPVSMSGISKFEMDSVF